MLYTGLDVIKTMVFPIQLQVNGSRAEEFVINIFLVFRCGENKSKMLGFLFHYCIHLYL